MYKQQPLWTWSYFPSTCVCVSPCYIISSGRQKPAIDCTCRWRVSMKEEWVENGRYCVNLILIPVAQLSFLHPHQGDHKTGQMDRVSLVFGGIWYLFKVDISLVLVLRKIGFVMKPTICRFIKPPQHVSLHGSSSRNSDVSWHPSKEIVKDQ